MFVEQVHRRHLYIEASLRTGMYIDVAAVLDMAALPRELSQWSELCKAPFYQELYIGSCKHIRIIHTSVWCLPVH